MKTRNLVGLALGTITTASLAIAAPASAQPSGGTKVDVPADVVVDASFDASGEVITVGDGSAVRSGDCKDRAFTAVTVMSQSLNGCSVIGTTAATKVGYGWYKHRGNANPCIWGKSFNSRHAPTWTALDCGTGRSKSVPWGNVAATKKVKGLTAIGWAGVQWH
ncbi:hypothetical protein [Curtobacterium luteum]|uniref:Secreted protein n=1 Tax=Curtobacterium luteum TaxID=33881 RepID=A0A175RGY0_9MICO|nr:hypothetical protein [Curtobacterium luteum]KTR02748.1 hypothetical protein NS184_15305 [Curtobacterium luteum]